MTGQVLDTGQELKGAASLGVQGTFEPPKELLEPYFFDFDGDLYGREIEVGAAPLPAARGQVRRGGGVDRADGRGLRAGAELLG